MKLVRNLKKPIKKIYIVHKKVGEKCCDLFYGLSIAAAIYAAMFKKDYQDRKKK